MSNEHLINKLICGDAREVLDQIEDNSIDIVLTDPPYFLDKLDNNWDENKVNNPKNQYIVKSLPAGMKFDRQQGIKFYEWYLEISKKLFRVIKPGGYFFSFSSPRLFHRMASAIDDAGFELRDTFIWLYTRNQPKAMGMNHIIDKLPISMEEKNELKNKLLGWKTPQLKSCYEPIAVAQKPFQNNYLQNMLQYKVGLVNTNIKLGENSFPANVFTTHTINNIFDKVFLIQKPNKKEKGSFNNHRTVKPLAICEYLIQLTAFDSNATILDPFVGSGTTVVAAKKLGKKFIGIDTNQNYLEIAQKRLDEIN